MSSTSIPKNVPTGVPVFSKGPPGPVTGKALTRGQQTDDTYYLQRPDVDFYRPWLYTPGGSAYVWPGGTEGFQLTSNATTGIHHYIGSNEVSVDVVYPDELHCVLTGTFPGKTSVDNIHALRSVILQMSTEAGKLLALPGIWAQVLYVQVINHQFNHDVGDGSSNITYSMEVIKVGTGASLKLQPLQIPQLNPQAVTIPRGKPQHVYVVKAGARTIRAIAAKVYGDPSQAGIQKLLIKNQNLFDSLGIPSYQRTTSPLPIGTKLEY